MPERRIQLWKNVRRLREGLHEAGFNIGSPQGAVTSIYTKGALALPAVRMIMDVHNVIVNPVMYPAVPYGTSIIRMTPSALHTADDMDQLVRAIVEVAKVLPLHEGNDAAASKIANAKPMPSAPMQNGSTANGSPH